MSIHTKEWLPEVGEVVYTAEPIWGKRRPLSVVRARKAHYCQDRTSPSHVIDKGDKCGSDPYGRVHYCVDHIVEVI